MALLEVEDLRVNFLTAAGVVKAVRGLSFDVEPGSTLGIVGESGSGKSVTAMAIPGLLEDAQVGGRVTFSGRDLMSATSAELQDIRGARIGMVFQNPFSSLHPAHRIGAQIAEVFHIHKDLPPKDAINRAIELLDIVGIPEPAKRVHNYPHQFSGGMLQRAMIAMAVALGPDLLIADEPTTALDATVQKQIIKLLKDLQSRMGMALIFVSHDLDVVSSIADRTMVMYAGKAMEVAKSRQLFDNPHHPYTRGLLACLPRNAPRGTRLSSITGNAPSPLTPPGGCAFAPRCEFVEAECHTGQPLVALSNGTEQLSACRIPSVRRQ